MPELVNAAVWWVQIMGAVFLMASALAAVHGICCGLIDAWESRSKAP